MNQAVEDCLIEGFEHLIDSLELPDLNDRHVLAAAISGRAEVIVTYNLKHFPAKILDKYGIEAQHPDEFIGHVIDLQPEKVCLAVKSIRKRLRNPPQDANDYLMSLAKQKLPQTISFLVNRKDFI